MPPPCPRVRERSPPAASGPWPRRPTCSYRHGKLPGVPKLRAIDAIGGDAFVDALRSAWDAHDAVLPVDPRLPPVARERLLERLGVGLPVEPGDAVVVATSGTTGEPKGVVLTHDAVRSSALAINARLAVDPATDVWLACLPVSHVGALAVVMRSVLTETPVVVHDGFDPEAAMASGATLTALVPTALQRVDPARFRVILLGGSTLPPQVPPNVVTTYGMTETGSGVVYDGVPLDGVHVKVVDGQIAVRAPMLLRCYRSAEGEHDPRDADGWFATGDGGSFDDSGRLVVEGRL